MPSVTLNETDDRFTVGDSTIPGAGKGVFAKAGLREGERLEVLGVLIPADSVSDACTRFADAYKFRAGDRLLLPVGFGALVNHSANPNLEKIVENGGVFFRAIRNIAPGEELFFTYSAYAQARFGLGRPK